MTRPPRLALDLGMGPAAWSRLPIRDPGTGNENIGPSPGLALTWLPLPLPRLPRVPYLLPTGFPDRP